MRGRFRDSTAKNAIQATYQIPQSRQLQACVSKEAPGHHTTHSDSNSINRMHPAARLLKNAPNGTATEDATVPATPKITDTVANGTTATFAKMPPIVIRPKIRAAIGVLAIQAAKDIPSAPKNHIPRKYHFSHEA